MNKNFIRPVESLNNQAKVVLKAFGLQAIRNVLITPPNAGTAQPDDGYLPQIKSQLLGLPAFDRLIFQATTWTDNQGNTQTIPQLVLDTVLITVTQTRNIIKTPVQGRDGTIKEYIADGDYYIRIRGMLNTGHQEYYPQDNMNILQQFCQAKVSFDVTSYFLSRFGNPATTGNITRIVIEDYEFPQLEGDRSSQPFEITALSDNPILVTTKPYSKQ